MLSLMCEFNHCVNVVLLCEYSVFGSTNVHSEHWCTLQCAYIACIYLYAEVFLHIRLCQCAQMPFNVLFLIREDLGLATETT